jgi:hypothetical protein
MLRVMNELGDRMLAVFVPRATAAAADCGSLDSKPTPECRNGIRWYCYCWSNSNCKCINCYHTTTTCRG